MKAKYLAFFILTAGLAGCFSKKKVNENRDNENSKWPEEILYRELNIGFYNLENLFDTINDPTINDDEFLPSAKKQYTSKRYLEKLEHLAKVVAEFKPAVLGVCEVENKAVLIDLCATLTKNYELEYLVAHHNSPDKRGIDVAFIYLKNEFELVELKAYPVKLQNSADFITRDIVRLGLKTELDTFYFFGNHWPSRGGGQQASEPKRMAAAFTLKKAVYDLQKIKPKANIFIMGDFNDEPFNNSIANAFKADSVLNATTKFFNTSYHLISKGQGTYNYKGNWNVLDQIIVSRNLVNDKIKNGAELLTPEAQVVKKDFMLYQTRSGLKVPSRSYGGPNYYGGYSDHLPTFITVHFYKGELACVW
ncbi:MAG: endonuclease/exonuclease/phosphatase family protein [Bacteroidia bacterium]